jgi:hypothetical protein
MQIKQAISNWANRWFFVKEKKPRLVIGLSSALIGVTVGAFADHSMRAQGVARVGSLLLAYITCMAVSFILAFTIWGFYNLCSWLVRDKTENIDKT